MSYCFAQNTIREEQDYFKDLAYVLLVEIKIDSCEVSADITNNNLTLNVSKITVDIVAALLEYYVSVSIKQSLSLIFSTTL